MIKYNPTVDTLEKIAKALGVDGCEFYVRLIGNEADREIVKKERER